MVHIPDRPDDEPPSSRAAHLEAVPLPEAEEDSLKSSSEEAHGQTLLVEALLDKALRPILEVGTTELEAVLLRAQTKLCAAIEGLRSAGKLHLGIDIHKVLTRGGVVRVIEFLAANHTRIDLRVSPFDTSATCLFGRASPPQDDISIDPGLYRITVVVERI